MSPASEIVKVLIVTILIAAPFVGVFFAIMCKAERDGNL